jgi:lysophospholipase L1-like esterase
LAILSPVVVLGLLEGTLRLGGMGLPTSFFVEAEVHGGRRWVNNPFYGYRFFPPELARNPAPIAIAAEKPAGTLRVAVLGESAAQGDPMLEFGMPRLLEKMLGAMDPSRPVEVVNAAMTAINSHVIADIARDLARIRPDVVVVYAGNNEVVGPYGPGTVFNPTRGRLRLTPLRVRLTRLRLAQLLRPRFGRTPKNWGGLEMFAKLHLAEDDGRMDGVAEDFRRNLEAVVASCRRAGARVVLSTVAVNLSDCPPFGSESPTTADAARRADWEAAVAEGMRAMERGDAEVARSAFGAAHEIDGRSADLAYRLAQAEQAAGNAASAAEWFGSARDLDTQRFRADRRLNQIVREVAEELGVECLDAEAAFGRIGPGNAAQGEGLFLDHVHFTFEGTWHLARLVAEAIAGAEAGPAPSAGECRRLAFFTAQAERTQAGILLARRERPPFKGQEGNEGRMDRLREIESRCAERMAEESLGDLHRQYEALALGAPDDFFLPFRWGETLASRRRWTQASVHLLEALGRVPHHFEARVLPAIALVHAGRTGEAVGVVLGEGPPYGLYLAENAQAVVRALEAAGMGGAAREFCEGILRRARRFAGRDALRAYVGAAPES